MPSSLRLYDAPVGHTGTQGGSSQCRHDFGKCTVCVFGYSPTSNVWTRLKKVPVGSLSYGLSSERKPAIPEVFHSLQLVTHAWQPTHTLRSMTNASWVMASVRTVRAASSARPLPGDEGLPGAAHALHAGERPDGGHSRRGLRRFI